MPERKVEVKTFKVEYDCDTPDCTGLMVPTGVMLASSPPKFPHVCPLCDSRITVVGKPYPYIDYQEVK